MTWIPGADISVSVNALVVLALFAGCLIGTFGGFFALFGWMLRGLRW